MFRSSGTVPFLNSEFAFSTISAVYLALILIKADCFHCVTPTRVKIKLIKSIIRIKKPPHFHEKVFKYVLLTYN